MIAMSGYVVAVDLGASRVRAAVFDVGNERFIHRVWEETRVGLGAEAISGQLVELVEKLLGEAGFEGVEGIGVGAPGPLDLRRGGIARAPNIPHGFIPVRAPLEERFGVPVELMNDANAAALGELLFGAGKRKRVENLVYLTFSTGIGGGIIESGRVLMGKDGNAGEVGCITIDYRGKLRCGCGGRGHWQAYASGAAIPRYLKLLEDEEEVDFEGSLLKRYGDLGQVSAKLLFEAAGKGDRAALEVVERLAEINAAGIGNVINAYDPELITIGGPIFLRNPSLTLEKTRPLIAEYAVNIVPEIILTPLGEDAGLYGAAAAIIQRLSERR